MTAATEFEALGSLIRVATLDPAALEGGAGLLRSRLEELDRACSRFRSDSELSEVNRRAGEKVKVSPLLWRALEAALEAARRTGGAVDPTIGRSLRVAGYDRDFSRLPPGGP